MLVGSTQPKVLSEFYTKVFEKGPDFEDGEYTGWQIGNAFFMMGSHSELTGSAKEPSRVILNFETPNVQSEFERIKGLGGTVAKEPYEIGGGWIATFADPDGNYFQLMTPMGP